MSEWKDIKTAPTDREILVARIDESGHVVYVVMVRWEIHLLGYIQRASVSGWYIEGIPMDKGHNRSVIINFGMLSTDPNCSPTHWKDL